MKNLTDLPSAPPFLYSTPRSHWERRYPIPCSSGPAGSEIDFVKPHVRGSVCKQFRQAENHNMWQVVRLCATSTTRESKWTRWCTDTYLSTTSRFEPMRYYLEWSVDRAPRLRIAGAVKVTRADHSLQLVGKDHRSPSPPRPASDTVENPGRHVRALFAFDDQHRPSVAGQRLGGRKGTAQAARLVSLDRRPARQDSSSHE